MKNAQSDIILLLSSKLPSSIKTSFLFASNITLYGFYHEALFFFVFINIISLLAVYLYRKREVAIDRASESQEDIEEDLDSEEEAEEEIPA